MRSSHNNIFKMAAMVAMSKSGRAQLDMYITSNQ